MSDEPSIEMILGGLSAIYDELKENNRWLRKLYDIDMTLLASDNPEVFSRLNLVHNQLHMFMDEDWEDELQ